MLVDLIKTHANADAEAGDWVSVASTLNAQTVEVRNAKSWTMADLIGLVGAEGAALVGGTIQAAGSTNPIFAGAWIALNVTGLQLHSDERQAMIAGLATAGSWPGGLTVAVKSAGLTYTSLAGSVVTAAECQSAYDDAKLESDWVTAQNANINAAVHDRVALVAALRLSADQLEVM
jgi:hypothetical protein